MRNAISVIILGLVLCLAPISHAAATVSILENGTADVAVPASQYINVFSTGTARVYKQVGGPSTNTAPQYVLETSGTVVAGEGSFGPYTNVTNIRIVAEASGALYSVGALAAVIPCERYSARVYYAQPSPVSQTTTVTLLATDLQAGIITGNQTSGATVAYTLPTGTLLDTASGLAINQGFEWSLINLSAAAADTITLTAGTGHTIVGTAVVASAHSTTGGLYGNASRWFSRKTAANTFVTYRIR